MNGNEEAARGQLRIFQERRGGTTRGVGTHFDPVINSSSASLDDVKKHLNHAQNVHATAMRAAKRLQMSVKHVTAEWGEEWIAGHTTSSVVNNEWC